MPTFGEIPVSAPVLQGIGLQPIMHPDSSQFQGISPMQLNGPYGDAQGYIPTREFYEKPNSYPHASYPWGHDAMGSQFAAAPYAEFSNSTTSTNTNVNTNTFDARVNMHPTQPSNTPQFQIPPAAAPHHHDLPLDPLQRELTPNPIDSIPDSWKTEGKQELLETLLQTITSCDEKSVAQVIGVVRASATPEAAVSGICQVLGISGISGQ